MPCDTCGYECCDCDRIRFTRTSDRVAEILIFGHIGAAFGPISAARIAELCQQNRDLDEIEVLIDSQGGISSEAVAIVAAFQRHPARIITTNMGLAASAAATIFCAGDVRRAVEAAQMMIHLPETGVYGTAADLRKGADYLDSVHKQVAGLYARTSGRTAAQCASWMEAETWFDTAAAQKAGFVTEIVTPQAVTNDGRRASLDLAGLAAMNYRNVPEDLQAAGEPRAAALSGRLRLTQARLDLARTEIDGTDLEPAEPIGDN